MTNRIYLLSTILLCLLASCTTETWYRTPTGLDYRVISSGKKDSIARMGQTVKIEVTQKVGDSVMETTTGKMPVYYMVMPGFGNRYNPLEVFDYGLRKGDSVVTLQLVDSMLHKKIFERIPPWMKKSDEWITTFKVVAVFTADSDLQKDKQEETRRVIQLQTALGKKRIAAWLAGHHVAAAPSGDVFTEIRTQGAGPLADSGKWVNASFEVRTLEGKLLNSTKDSSGHDTPKNFLVGKGTLPPTLEKEVKKIRQGSTVAIYAPAVLLFGVTPPEKLVKIDDDIIFTIKLLEVSDTSHITPDHKLTQR